MPRTMLTDEQWTKLRSIMLTIGIYNKSKLRLTVEGILYRLRVGCPWRDLPPEFGNWNQIYKRFNAWSNSQKIRSIFQKLCTEPDLEWEFIDGSLVKAHQHSSGAAQGQERAIGKSVAGNSTKIHLAVDSFGLPLHFDITGGEVHECKIAVEFFQALPPSKFKIADRGYDSEPLREQVRNLSETPLIPRKKNSLVGNDDIDWYLYKLRHLVENAFARLKHFRSVATRFDKLKRNYEATVALACSLLWLPM
jgi:transposase